MGVASIDVLVLIAVLVTTVMVSRTRANKADVSLDSLKPIAMDESIKIIRSSGPSDLDDLGADGMIERHGVQRAQKGAKGDFNDSKKNKTTTLRPGGVKDKLLLDPATEHNADPEKSLFRIPKETSLGLGKLITGYNVPTFVDDDALPSQLARNQKDNGVIAHYRIIVPIWVPALRKKKPIENRMGGDNRMDIKFVKETRTEMVPVEHVVQHRHEVIKAEQVPQEIKTNFVKVDESNGIPPLADAELGPGEKVVSSVVNNYT